MSVPKFKIGDRIYCNSTKRKIIGTVCDFYDKYPMCSDWTYVDTGELFSGNNKLHSQNASAAIPEINEAKLKKVLKLS